MMLDFVFTACMHGMYVAPDQRQENDSEKLYTINLFVNLVIK